MKILNLHTHSEFSNLSCGFPDSINKLEPLLDYSLNKGHAGLAITDHESVTAHFTATEWYQKRLKEVEELSKTNETLTREIEDSEIFITSREEEAELGELEDHARRVEQNRELIIQNSTRIKTILDFKLMMGNEIYIAREDLTQETFENGENFYHFLLVALDKEGEAQLRKLSTMAWEKSFMRGVMRRFNYISELQEVIGNNPGHVIASTACIGNLAGVLFRDLESPEESIEGYLKTMQNIFGDGNFFVELAPSGYEEQINYNTFMYNTFKDKYPFIITNDVHYLEKDDFGTMEIFLKSRGGQTTAEDYYKYSHFMTYEEIVSIMSYLPKEFIDKSMQNALDIGQRSSMYSLRNKTVIPKVPNTLQLADKDLREYGMQFDNIKNMLTSSEIQNQIMANKVLIGYQKKENDTPERRKLIFERLNNEWNELLGISEIQGVSLSDYLLTVEWLVNEFWRSGSLVGPGRGSAVSFVTNYYLGITTVNPVDYPIEIPYWR